MAEPAGIGQQQQMMSTASQSAGAGTYANQPATSVSSQPAVAESESAPVSAPESAVAPEPHEVPPPPPAPPPVEEDDDDDQRDDEDEEEEEDEDDKIIERSHNERWAKRNNRLPRHAPGVTGSYLAIDQRVGKDVIWNEIILKEEQASEALLHRFTNTMKRLNRKHHPNMVRYLDYWTTELEDRGAKLVLITERTEEGTLKQFMSNTNRSRAIWQRCMANLLSVLKFFLELGLTHGNLTSETIHYQQKSGNLKVGTMAMDDLLNPKANRDRSKFVTVKHYLAPEYADAACKITPAVDIYALGVIALELAVWERKDDLIPNSEDRIDAMLRKVSSPETQDFIRGCLHPDPCQRHTWWHLYRHPAVFVVPKLDVFAARAYISHLPPSLDHKAMREQLDQMLERFENDTVMVEMTKGGQVRERLYKDLICHTLNCKFLEDVKNGFHPIFGFGDRDEVHMLDGKPHLKRPKDPTRTLSDAAHCRCSDAADYSGLTGAACQAGPGIDSIAGGFEASGGCVLVSSSGHGLLSLGGGPGISLAGPGVAGGVEESAVPGSAVVVGGQALIGHRCATWPGSVAEEDVAQISAAAAVIAPKEDVGVPGGNAGGVAGVSDAVGGIAVGGGVTGGGNGNADVVDGLGAVSGSVPAAATSAGEAGEQTAAVVAEVAASAASNAVAAATELIDEEVEDEEEDEDGKRALLDLRELERLHGPPAQDRQESLQFLDTELQYIGLGRWNCHLKVWFDERHILRNVNVQLTEQRYCQPRAIARQFVEDQVCGSQDEEALARRIAFAYLGHPTVNGRVRDYQELCAKLGWAQPPSPQQQHQQQQLDAQSSGERGTSRQASRDNAGNGGLGSGSGNNNRNTPPHAVAPAAPAPATGQQQQQQPPTLQPQNLLSHQLDCELLSRKLEAVAKQRQEAEERQRLRDCTYERICAGPRQPDHDDADCVLVPVEAPPSELFWGCGPTCRSYRECRWHDRCDYLSRSDLPTYLTARCYHCREQLAKESGIDAFTLWWMHSQNRIPYPYFLQVRFGYPLEPVTQEDIRYECRFRGRRPCRCLRDKRTGRVLELPPCTEFPEDYASDGEDPAAAAGSASTSAAAVSVDPAGVGRAAARRSGGHRASITSRCWISRYMEERKRRQRRNSSCAGWQQFYGHRKHNSF